LVSYRLVSIAFFRRCSCRYSQLKSFSLIEATQPTVSLLRWISRWLAHK